MVTHCLQQGHTCSNKATLPNTATPLGVHFLSNYHKGCVLLSTKFIRFCDYDHCFQMPIMAERLSTSSWPMVISLGIVLISLFMWEDSVDGAFWQQPHNKWTWKKKDFTFWSHRLPYGCESNLFCFFAANSFTDIRTSFSSLLMYT